MFDYILDIDKELFLLLNGCGNSFFDNLMLLTTDRWTWIPLYIFLIGFIYLKQKRESWLTFVVITILITVNEQITSSFVKEIVMRPRPCHVEELKETIRLLKNCGSEFGFFSAHASNTFAIATFLFLIFRKSHFWMFIFVFVWAAFVSYSRIYVGVHYPLDILFGAAFGTLCGWGFFQLMGVAKNFKKEKKNVQNN